MESREEWLDRFQFEAKRHALIMETSPGLRDSLLNQAEFEQTRQQLIDQSAAGFEPRGGLVGFAEDVGTGWWEFLGRKLPASILYSFSSDAQFKEALDDISNGLLSPGGIGF